MARQSFILSYIIRHRHDILESSIFVWYGTDKRACVLKTVCASRGHYQLYCPIESCLPQPAWIVMLDPPFHRVDQAPHPDLFPFPWCFLLSFVVRRELISGSTFLHCHSLLLGFLFCVYDLDPVVDYSPTTSRNCPSFALWYDKRDTITKLTGARLPTSVIDLSA
jgi:hypothetical protein